MVITLRLRVSTERLNPPLSAKYSIRKVSIILYFHGHLQNEAAARSGRAFQLDLPTVRLDDLARYTQPQPHALDDTPSLATADEWLKDFILLIERDAGSRIVYLNEQSTIRSLEAGGDLSPGRCELDGVT